MTTHTFLKPDEAPETTPELWQVPLLYDRMHLEPGDCVVLKAQAPGYKNARVMVDVTRVMKRGHYVGRVSFMDPPEPLEKFADIRPYPLHEAEWIQFEGSQVWRITPASRRTGVLVGGTQLLEWGLQADREYVACWSARAFFREDGDIEMVPDRQDWRGSREDRARLCEWVNDTALPILRKRVREEGLKRTDTTVVEIDRPGLRMIASPRGTYGHIYLCAMMLPVESPADS